MPLGLVGLKYGFGDGQAALCMGSAWRVGAWVVRGVVHGMVHGVGCGFHLVEIQIKV